MTIGHEHASGLTKRELFAAMAMQSLASQISQAIIKGDDKHNQEIPRAIISDAVKLADLLIAELNK
jgi:hypothetical protein